MRFSSAISAALRLPLEDLLHRPDGQIPALDALRTLAILLVIAAHTAVAYIERGGAESWLSRLPIVRGGWMGVDLFFVLSGYFIGKQLWRELKASGSINFKRFIVRRGLRIWPLYFFTFAFVLIVLRRGVFPWGRWWSDPIFLTNYFDHGVVMGSWSLCTEEQFYIAAPLLMILGASRSITFASWRKYLLALLVLLPLCRAVTWYVAVGGLGHHDREQWMRLIYTPIHTHSDGLVMGLLISHAQVAGARGFIFLRSIWCVPAAIIVCLLLQRANGVVFDFSGLALAFGAMTWFALTSTSAVLRLADGRIFYVLSRLSFGMYLNHEYLHQHIAAAMLRWLPLTHRLPAFGQAATIGTMVVASAAIALVTFCVVEYPFLQLRHRLLISRFKDTRPAPQALGQPKPATAEVAAN